MSGWPWMKGACSAIDNPIQPLDDHDDRPAIRDLIAENQALIDKFLRDLSADPLFQADKHDQLWALRFILSHKKKIKPALKAAKSTLVFRHENRLDVDIRDSPPQAGNKSLACKPLQRYIEAGLTDDAIRFCVPDPQRGVVALIKATGIDPHALVENVDEQDWLPAMTYFSEWSFQWVDFVSRTTGRLTKSIRVIDLQDIHLNFVNREKRRRDAA